MNGAYTRRIKVVGEKDQKRKSVFYVVLSAIILLVIVWLVIDALSGKNKTDDVSAEATEKTETQIIEVEKVVEVEKTITTEMLQESLNEMGVLVTEEYYFTQVENYEKTKPVFKIFTSKSNCIYSYDGVVAAGIDFNSISLEKDEENKVISILVPASTIQYVDIDYESFLYMRRRKGFGIRFPWTITMSRWKILRNLPVRKPRKRAFLKKRMNTLAKSSKILYWV
jgi:hypothetical protein